MSPIQQMLLGGGGAGATKTYIDDIFSTYVYKATGSSGQQINNGVDLTDKGLVWFKGRSNAWSNALIDTERGGTKLLYTDLENTEGTFTDAITSFNNNGFTTGTNQFMNYANTHTYASWTFKAVPGFLDIVEYPGTGSAKTVAHSLGSIPGLILIKAKDSSENWRVYHKSLTATHHLVLNLENKANTGTAHFNDTNPTASVFSVGTDDAVNQDGKNFIAYLFAGGESTAATARSVDFDGSGDYLGWAATSDFAFGTGAYTVEFWLKPESLGNTTFFNVAATNGFAVTVKSDNVTITKYGSSNLVETSVAPPIGQWTHYALVREGTGSNQTKIYKNGILEKAGTDSTDWTVTAATGLGANAAGEGKEFDGKISNFRVVKGTAVYTSSFRPPTEPLTNITNTVLLCCNNSSTTGSTVTPGTITANGNPTASSDSPFDDPAGFDFGDAGDQNVIKCGSYVGNTQTDGPHVYLGWEPQYLWIKNAGTNNTPWQVWDSMRGVLTGGNDEYLRPDSSDSTSSYERISFTPTGFKLDANSGYVNESGKELIYVAIRRPDGYVGKPPALGTDVFNVDTGNGSTTGPAFDSNFAVDMGLKRAFGDTYDWGTHFRLTGPKDLRTNTNDNEGNDNAGGVFDYMNGLGKGSHLDSSTFALMFKRHAGMDVVAFKGNGSARSIPHSMNAIPEFIILKNRETTGNQWYIYHKGLNGGTNPEDYYVKLGASGDAAEAGDSGGSLFNSTAPTSTHFSVGTSSAINESGKGSIAILFSSVNGISKVGSYDGSDSSQTITTGFQPRFLILKRMTEISGVNNPWYVLDTTRGWGSGDDKYLELQTSGQQGDFDFGAPTSTGFTLIGNNNGISKAGSKYLYYAHA